MCQSAPMEQGSEGIKVLKVLVPEQLHRELKIAAAKHGETLQAIALEAILQSPRLNQPESETLRKLQVESAKLVTEKGASAATREPKWPVGADPAMSLEGAAGESRPACIHPRTKLEPKGNGVFRCRACGLSIKPTHPERF